MRLFVEPRWGSLFFVHSNPVCAVRHWALEWNCVAVLSSLASFNPGYVDLSSYLPSLFIPLVDPISIQPSSFSHYPFLTQHLSSFVPLCPSAFVPFSLLIAANGALPPLGGMGDGVLYTVHVLCRKAG